MRVYEIAREVGLANKELIAKIRALGLEVNNHMSTLDAEDVARVRRSLDKERLANTVTTHLSSTVLRRRSKEGGHEVAASPVASAHGAAPPTRAPRPPAIDTAAAAKPVVRRRFVERPVEPDDVPTTPIEPVATRPAATRPATRVVARPELGAEPRDDEQDDRGAEPARELDEVVEVRREPVQDRPSVSRTAPTVPITPIREPEPQADEAANDQDEDDRLTTPQKVVTTPAAVVPPPAPPPSPSPVMVDMRAPLPSFSRGARAEQPAPSSRPAVPAAPAMPDEPAGPPARDEEPAERPSFRPAAHAPRETLAAAARSQFELELERARRQAEDRDKERQAQRVVTVETISPRTPGRPEVGSIIALPMTRIQITDRGPAKGPGATQVRGRFAVAQQQRGRLGPSSPRGARDSQFGKKRLPVGKKSKSTEITTPAEHKRVIKMEETIAIPDLAHHMGIKATEALKKLWGMGMVGVNINAAIDFETASVVAAEYGYEVQNVAFKEEAAFLTGPDEEGDMVSRAPVVTIMGHVDHGKTTLLDAIRKTHVAAGEAGGITQHIAAYRVRPNEELGDIVFLDTPGHEAFTAMRARGAQATDIVVLVVAADDGVMPQTVEALNHARDAKVPVIVAVNKSDLPGAQPERIRQQLSDHGLIPEAWGGDTLYVDVAALKGKNIDKLLEAIGLQAEVLELKANPNKPASGVVIEAKLDRNRGPMATILIQEGTLRVGDIVVAGESFGKVRAMLDETGRPVDEAGPSTPVEMLGLDGVPDAGETVHATEDEKMAKQVVEHRRQQKRKKELATSGRVSLENILEKIAEGEAKELKVVLKADVQGSAEALREALHKLSTDKVRVNVIQAGVGGITESDVNLARAGGAIIVGFHVRAAGKAGKLAEQEGVQIKLYDIIYEALDEVKAAMAGLLAPIKREKPLGKAEVREVFTIAKIGTIAGSVVNEGKITRRSLLRLIRDAVQVYVGKVASLRRFKDDVSEVLQGYECGITIDGFNDIKQGDIIEAYEVVEEAATL